MFDAIKTDNSKYAAFAASMLVALAAEEASIAKLNASMTKYVSATADTSAATVRPSK